MMAAAPVAGQLFTWGRNSDGQCGQTEVAHPPRNCALPHPVRGLDSVTHVACGGGQQGCTFAVTSGGALGRGALLGGCVDPTPRAVALGGVAGAARRAVSIDAEHGYSAAVLESGALVLWGSNEHGKLGS